MKKSRKKQKIIYVLAAAGLLLLALGLLYLMIAAPWKKAEPEPTPEPTAAAAATPRPNTVSVAGKDVEPDTDSFDLSGRTLSEQDMAEIASLKNLTTLSLTNCGVTDLRFVSELADLRTLYLPDNKINDLTPLSGLRSLRTLYLDRNPLTDLSPLTTLPSLTTLSLKGVVIPDYVLTDLAAALPGCRVFSDSAVEAARTVTMGGAAFTEDAETLDLSDRGITDIGKLSYCLQLRELDLSGNPLGELSVLSGLPKLIKLSLARTGLTDEDLSFLGTLQRLAYLDVRDNDALSAGALEALEKALPKCQVVHDTVYYRVRLGQRELTSDMTEADLSAAGVTELTGLEQFAQLRRLDLRGNSVTDLTPLAGLFALEELELSYNQLRDIAALSGHTALRKLDLSHNDVLDIYPLAGCTGLEELDLSHNRIDYLSHLNTCTALRKLDLTGNNLTADQIRRLQEALPGCQIITDVDLSMPEPTPEPPSEGETWGD